MSALPIALLVLAGCPSAAPLPAEPPAASGIVPAAEPAAPPTPVAGDPERIGPILVPGTAGLVACLPPDPPAVNGPIPSLALHFTVSGDGIASLDRIEPDPGPAARVCLAERLGTLRFPPDPAGRPVTVVHPLVRPVGATP
jgi:hypothetical protein